MMHQFPLQRIHVHVGELLNEVGMTDEDSQENELRSKHS